MSNEETAPVEDSPHQSGELESTSAKWWVEVEGEPDGPHGAAYIALLLDEHRVKPTTLVCEVGKQEWQPVIDAAGIIALADFQSSSKVPPPLPASSDASQKIGFFGRFTNPALPRFANWICVYCILVVPAFVALYFLFTIGGLNSAADLKYDSPLVLHAVAYDVITLVADIALAVVLVIGGFSLRSLRKSGATLIKAGLLLGICWTVIELVVMILWEAIVTVGDASEPVSEEFAAGDVLSLLLFVPFFIAALACMVFEIVALIWLIKNDHRLPLKSRTAEEDKP